MDCAICLGERILEKDMHYMECLHSICFSCFTQLVKDTCPLCRTQITILNSSRQIINNNNILDNETNVDNTFEDDFIIPVIRRNRHEYRRNKKQRRRDRLYNLINDINASLQLPNFRKRCFKKMRRL